MTNLTSMFISSKMQELAQERKILFDFLPSLSDSLINLKPWVFENDAPASSKSIREVYLEALQNSALYIGIFWNEYGEYTIDEFDRAGEWNIPRHIYVKDIDTDKRDPRLSEFLSKNGDVRQGITAKWFKTDKELKAAIQQSLEIWIKERLKLRGWALRAALYTNADEVREMAETGLIGRDQLYQQIKETLSGENARLLLQAFGGTGKTALAAHIAYDWLETYKGKVLWLRLGVSSKDDALEALAYPFGASQMMASAQGEAKEKLLLKLLKEHNVNLVVLDDVWNGLALQSIQAAIPRKIPLLVTARQRYPLRTIIAVPDLEPDAAVRFLRELAPDLAKDNQAAYALCADLSYLAFGIEVAGRTMKAKNYTAAILRQQIANTDITRLEVPLDYRVEGRESIAALIQNTLNALPTAAARNVFLSWGAFWSPQITSEMMLLFFIEKPEIPMKMIGELGSELRKIAPFSDDEVKFSIEQNLLQKHYPKNHSIAEDALNLLSQYGLANLESSKQPAFYRLHDLACVYASAQSKDMFRNKAVDACLSYTKQYSAPSLINFATLACELSNFMGAAEFAFQKKRFLEVEEFAINLIGSLNGFLSLQGYNHQAKTLLQLAAQSAEKARRKQNQGIHLGNLAGTLYSLGQYQEAIEYHEKALEISIETKNKEGEGQALGNLGLVYSALNQHQQAVEYHKKSLKVAREIGNKEGEGASLSNLGICYGQLGQYEQAIQYFEQALRISRKIGHKQQEAKNLGNLSLAYDGLRQYQKAIDNYQQALTISRNIGDKLTERNQLNGLGLAYMGLQDYLTSITYFEQAFDISKQLGNAELIETVEHNLAMVREKMAKG